MRRGLRPGGVEVITPDLVKIASKEEANPNPLADLPTQYCKFAKVFGEEEFKVLPPHWEYNIAIDLIPDAKLSPGPIYGMTDAESKALKQHIVSWTSLRGVKVAGA
ncbi:hypothetical protein RhiXN_08721 [Rhizoctonia solani]|uniref:Uncharacterized protein n=1 Tax=Rhizoctonia solani TaxID=456999 RepID=A0A8H8P3C0_9AGAM|nr:uncharacterized protein RhiXN_08721 [Rhizoctonia solani]QRW23685.1 hypothetical protein RhiXN_08721 [Rhizoctonia solani]